MAICQRAGQCHKKQSNNNLSVAVKRQEVVGNARRHIAKPLAKI
jgi:hypothetical protein